MKDNRAATSDNLSLGFPTRFNTSRTEQPQKMARGLEYWIYKVEGLYYLRCENKGADQLRDHCTAYLCLRFHMCKKQVLSSRSSIIDGISTFKIRINDWL